MTIDFRAMTQTLRKKAFNAVLNCIPDEDEKKEVKAIMKGNKTDNIMQLLYLKDSYIPDIKLLEQATDAEGAKIIKSAPISVAIAGTIKDLKDFSIHLMTFSNIDSVSDVTPQAFGDWQHDQLLKRITAANTPAAPVVQTPVVDLTRQIEAVNKFDTKGIPHWNGKNVGDYPRNIRLTKQVFRNYGMIDLVKDTTTPLLNWGF